MNTNEIRLTVLRIMTMLNLAMVIFISVTSAVSVYKMSESVSARSYLEKFSVLPPIPWTIPFLAIGCYILLMFVLYIRMNSDTSYKVLIILQIVLGIIIILALHLNYTGIIFLVSAHLLDIFKQDRKKIQLITFISVILLIFDYNFCHRFLPILPYDILISYYRDVVASLIIAGKNLGTTINMILFIVYTILLLGEQIDEKEKITDLNRQLNMANIELQNANMELENYAKESERIAQTKERNRLAREIHDTLGHTLTGIIAGLDAAIAIMPIAPEQTKLQLDKIQEVARQGMTDVRRSVNALRPDVLEREDLGTAIENTIKQMAEASNVEISYVNKIEQLRFNADEEEVIYRIIQESITNSIRHGKATKVEVYMEKEYSIITLIIKDNGIGSPEIKDGFGLTHMRERLNMLKGQLYLDGTDGFTVKAIIPIRWGEEND